MAEPIRSISKPETLPTRPILHRSASSTGPIRLCRCSSPAADGPSMSARKLAGNKKRIDKEHLMTSIARSLAYIALVAFLFTAPAHADEVKAGDLVITQAWSRATPGGAKIAGGYLTIENKGAAPDRLMGGSGDVAAKVEVHEMATKDGVMTMRPLDKGLPIEPGKTVKLAPGGYHLMMMDLKNSLKQGDKVPLELQFEKAGKVTVSLDVQGVGAQAPAGAGHSSGQHDMKK